MTKTELIDRINQHYPNDTDIIVGVLWNADDICQVANDNLWIQLTDQQIAKVAAYLESEHDAECGITWDTIEIAISRCIKVYGWTVKRYQAEDELCEETCEQ